MYTPTIEMTYSDERDEYDIWLVDSEGGVILNSFSDFIEAVWYRDNQREELK
jgi:hypothetical protein